VTLHRAWGATSMMKDTKVIHTDYTLSYCQVDAISFSPDQVPKRGLGKNGPSAPVLNSEIRDSRVTGNGNTINITAVTVLQLFLRPAYSLIDLVFKLPIHFFWDTPAVENSGRDSSGEK